MSNFDCPSCGVKAARLIIFENPRKLGCDSCGTPKRPATNVNLGQTANYYVKKDGSRGRMTVGKAWEIEHRSLSPDGRVINSKTGKEAQF